MLASFPPFLFFAGARGEPGNEAKCMLYVCMHATAKLKELSCSTYTRLLSPATGCIMGLLYFHQRLKPGLQNVAVRPAR